MNCDSGGCGERKTSGKWPQHFRPFQHSSQLACFISNLYIYIYIYIYIVVVDDCILYVFWSFLSRFETVDGGRDESR